MNKCTNDRGTQWFHGSPEKLETLFEGSMITPYKEVARAFSHKPSCISASDGYGVVKHNGSLPGYLYIVAEDLQKQDLALLPGTDNTHWQINRELRVELVEHVPIIEAELLTEQAVEGISPGFWSSHDYEAVRELHSRGLSRVEIARRLKLDSGSVDKYVKAAEEPPD